MITRYIPARITRTASRAVLKANKNSPQLLFVGGVVGVVGATVLACRATLKVEEVVEDHEKDMRNIRMARELHTIDYTDTDRKRDTAIVYGRTTGRIVKLYGPAIILGSVSIAALTKSHDILSKRNAALSAAYAGLEATFGNYRERVKAELGDEKEREIYNDVRVVEVKDGKSVTITKQVGSNGGSQFARFYDENNRNYVVGSPEMNIMVLRQRQNYLNDRLRMRGHLFLNEAYDELGFEHTEAGAVCGWIFDPDGLRNDGVVRDSHVDFGIWEDSNRDSLVDFVVGAEGGIFLDFNVDGEIHKLIETTTPIWKYADKQIGRRG